MKHYFKHFILLASMPLVCFCAKNNIPAQSEEGEIITITASIPEQKISLTPSDEPALTLAWEDGDEIVVEGTEASTFTVSEIMDDHKATFTGSAVDGSVFAVYYPNKSILNRSYEGQVQDGNGSTEHLVYNAMVNELENYESFTFNKVNGAIKLVVNVPESVTEVSSISITSQDPDGEEQEVFYKTNDENGEMTATLSLDFINTYPEGGVLTAYAMVSWNAVELAQDSRLAIKLTAAGKTCSYEKTIKVSETTVIAGGETFIIDMSEAAALKHVIAGSGTESDPYLLYDAEDMLLMNDLLVADNVTYFKMMDDIDMEGIDWVGGNQASPYKQHIDFDGNGKTISNLTCTKTGIYPGLIGVLSGRVANVTLTDPVVSTNKHGGIICGYAGTSGTKPAIIENITVIRGKITQTGGSRTGIIFGHTGDVTSRCEYTNINVIDAEIIQNGIGASGFIGGAQNKPATYTNCHASGTLTISSTLAPTNGTSLPSGGIQGHDNGSTYTNCSFTGTINGGRLCGGIVGYNAATNFKLTNCYVDATLNISTHGSKSSGECCGGLVGFLTGGTISNSYTKGSLKIPGQIAGGLVGNVKSMSTITNCWSSMNITAERNAAGIVARAASDSWNYTANKCLEISNCVYFGTKIDFKGATKANGSSGSIIGMTALKNVFSNCWRINDSKCTFVNTKNTVNKPVDQPDCNGSNWSVSADAATGEATQIGTGVIDEQQYLFPYWGKAAEADATVSSIVINKSLGWDTTIWNLSGNHPTLNNNPEPVK